MSFQAVLGVLLVLYLALMVLLGWVGRQRTHGVGDYYVGGRSLGGVALGLSFFATYASTNSYLGFSGKSYAYGAPWLLLVPFAVGLSLLAWTLVAPRLREFTGVLDSLTIPDFLGTRFDSPAARFVSAVLVLLASLLYLTAVYKGIGNLFESLLGISYLTAVGLVLAIVVTYTSIGGFHSVVRTDVVQALLMIGAAVLLFVGTTRALGGVGALFELSQHPETESLFQWNVVVPTSVLLGTLFATTVKFLVEPRQLSRFFALKSAREARRGIWVSTLTFFVVFSLLTPLGMMARPLLLGLSDTDRVIPELLAAGVGFGPVSTAFLMLAILSAAMSSLDSVLLVMASTFERDVMVKLRVRSFESQSLEAQSLEAQLLEAQSLETQSRERESQETGAAAAAARTASTLRSTRSWVVVFALLAAIAAIRPPGGIVELTSFSGAVFGACFLPPVLLGLHWRRGSGASVLTAIGSGLLVLLIWRFTPWSKTVHAVFPAIVLSTSGYWLVAHQTAAALPERLEQFFVR